LNCSLTGVEATRSGWRKMLREPSENSMVRNGRFRTIWKRLSSTALTSLSMAAIVCPIGSFCIHRLTDATASRASTGTLSWKISPSRSVIVQVSSSDETSAPAAAWGCGARLWSSEYSVSHTM
jgi:hypothetical protein